MQSVTGKDKDTGHDLHYAPIGQHHIQYDEESDALPDAGDKRGNDKRKRRTEERIS